MDFRRVREAQSWVLGPQHKVVALATEPVTEVGDALLKDTLRVCGYHSFCHFIYNMTLKVYINVAIIVKTQ